jgi:hypothetical protein
MKLHEHTVVSGWFVQDVRLRGRCATAATLRIVRV